MVALERYFFLLCVLLLDDVGSDGCLEDIGEGEGVGGLAAVGAEDADSGTGRHVWREEGEMCCLVSKMRDDEVNWTSLRFC